MEDAALAAKIFDDPVISAGVVASETMDTEVQDAGLAAKIFDEPIISTGVDTSETMDIVIENDQSSPKMALEGADDEKSGSDSVAAPSVGEGSSKEIVVDDFKNENNENIQVRETGKQIVEILNTGVLVDINQ